MERKVKLKIYSALECGSQNQRIGFSIIRNNELVFNNLVSKDIEKYNFTRVLIAKEEKEKDFYLPTFYIQFLTDFNEGVERGFILHKISDRYGKIRYKIKTNPISDYFKNKMPIRLFLKLESIDDENWYKVIDK